MDDNICALEELAAEEWRAGHRIKVPLVYETAPVVRKQTPAKQTLKIDSPITTHQSRRVRLIPQAVDGKIYLREVHRDILQRVHDRYTSECVPYSKPPKFPEFPPSRPSSEMEIIASLRPHGARFIHYPENYADCSCFIAPQLMNYFERRFIRPPYDRFDEDYFGDVNFQKFLLGLFDQYALLHHSRTFTVIGFYSKTWFLVTFGTEITEQLFKDRSAFIVELKTRLQQAHSLAWPKSFLMCPSPYPYSFVIPMRDKNDISFPTCSYRDALALTSSPEVRREADPIVDLESTIAQDDLNLSGPVNDCDSILDTAFLENPPREDSLIDLNLSSASSLEGECPIDSTWMDSESSSKSSELSFTQKDRSPDFNECTEELFSFEESIEDEVFFCLQEMLAAVLSDCECPLHDDSNKIPKNLKFIQMTNPSQDLNPGLNPSVDSTVDSMDNNGPADLIASSMNEFDPLVDVEAVKRSCHHGVCNSKSEDQAVPVLLGEIEFSREALQVEAQFVASTKPSIQKELLSRMDSSLQNIAADEVVTPLVPLNNIIDFESQSVAALTACLEVSGMSGNDSNCTGETTSPQRTCVDPPHKSIIQLTSSGASFRKTSAERRGSLPATGMSTSREESLFLADTISALRPYGVRFIADLKGYNKCSCRPSKAILQSWNQPEKLNIVADFDMDQFGDMLLANFITSKDTSATLLLHYAGFFDIVAVDENHWTYIRNDYGEIRREAFDSGIALFTSAKKQISRMFNSQQLLEKYLCPLPEGMVQNDTTSTVLKKAIEVKESVASNVSKQFSTLESQKESLGKKFAAFMNRMSHQEKRMNQ